MATKSDFKKKSGKDQKESKKPMIENFAKLENFEKEPQEVKERFSLFPKDLQENSKIIYVCLKELEKIWGRLALTIVMMFGLACYVVGVLLCTIINDLQWLFGFEYCKYLEVEGLHYPIPANLEVWLVVIGFFVFLALITPVLKLLIINPMYLSDINKIISTENGRKAYEKLIQEFPEYKDVYRKAKKRTIF